MNNKYLLKLLTFCLLTLAFSSCVNLTKRVHRNGYHIEWDIVNEKKNATIKNKTSIKTSSSFSNNSLESIDYKHFTKEKPTPNTASDVFNSGQDFATQIDQEHRKSISTKNTIVLTETTPKIEENLAFKKLPKDDFVISESKKGESPLVIFGKICLSVLLALSWWVLEANLFFYTFGLAYMGQERLASVLFISGTVGLIILLIYGLLFIWKKNRGRNKDLTDVEKEENKTITRAVVLSVLFSLIVLPLIIFMTRFLLYW